MRDNLVSIVMPARNHGEYIGQAIESVLNQSWQDWELLIIDDASDDGSQDIINTYQEHDARIHYIYLDRPIKRSGLVRNIGVEKSNGQYLAFLDADDVWLPNKLTDQIAFMRNRGAVFCTSYIDVINLGGVFIRSYRPVYKKVAHGEMLAECFVSTSATILDQSQILNIQFTGYKYCQDFVCWMDILRRGHLVHIMPVATTLYRINPRFHILKKFSRLFYRWHIHYFHLKRPFLLSIKDCLYYVCAGYRKHR